MGITTRKVLVIWEDLRLVGVSWERKSERKKYRIHLCFVDSTLMKLRIQSIHQSAELSITLGCKVTQKECLTSDGILHRVGNVANLVEHLVVCGCPYTIDALSGAQYQSLRSLYVTAIPPILL